MKFLTLPLIKAQLRLDDQQAADEAELLEAYGESAEETLFAMTRRSYEDLMETYGRVPAPLRQAALMLVDLSYKERSPVSPQNMAAVPYTFDLLVKPYMRLTANENDYENENTYNTYGCKNL